MRLIVSLFVFVNAVTVFASAPMLEMDMGRIDAILAALSTQGNPNAYVTSIVKDGGAYQVSLSSSDCSYNVKFDGPDSTGVDGIQKATLTPICDYVLAADLKVINAALDAFHKWPGVDLDSEIVRIMDAGGPFSIETSSCLYWVSVEPYLVGQEPKAKVTTACGIAVNRD